MTKYNHIPVLLQEAIQSLNIKKNGIYIDGTFGNGGHSKMILKNLNKYGKLYAIDRDKNSIILAQQLCDPRIHAIHGRFSTIENNSNLQNIIGKTDGILLDLGISSLQLLNPKRGFSFMLNGPLDMRMDPSQGISASQWLFKSTERDISLILKNFGEEKFSKRIAQAIYKYQSKSKPITSTHELSEIIKKTIPIYYHHRYKKHPATRSFQAIRIYINQELDEIKKILHSSLKILKPGGRLSIISFHSLEDRIIKRFMMNNSTNITVPIGLPITDKQLLTLKPYKFKLMKKIFPSKNEIQQNPKSRSAILRTVEKK